MVIQRGGDSLLDIEGGNDSVVKYSVLKSISSSFNLAQHRAKLANQKTWFDYSIYSLPLAEQNTLKWLMIFPLAILIIVLMRNVVGVQTMGTFTPMLIAMSLVKTGFVSGLVCFSFIIIVGLLIRALLSKLNLLLVPRISAVVIVVILLMQSLTIFGYQLKIDIASSAVFSRLSLRPGLLSALQLPGKKTVPSMRRGKLSSAFLLRLLPTSLSATTISAILCLPLTN